jgi:hypothetical protein
MDAATPLGAFDAPRSIKTFNYTGAQQNFTVPEGVTQIVIQASGAGGGIGLARESAAGGFVKASIPVTSSESLAVFVGGMGNSCTIQGCSGSDGAAGGFNGGGDGFGGGGGASDVRQGGSALGNRVVDAAGGGGGSDLELACVLMNRGAPGGRGGDFVGGRGGGVPYAGHGGTQNSGGRSGRSTQKKHRGTDGAEGIGGNGDGAGGGGGGGYYGGGGGSYFFRSCPDGQGADGYSGGGGGGSSYVEKSATHVTMLRGGGSTGNGVVVISW